MESSRVDDTIKKAVKAIEEAKLLGYHSTDIIVENMSTANEIEILLCNTPQLVYRRNKTAFELEWTDEHFSVSTAPITEEDYGFGELMALMEMEFALN